MKKYIFLFMLTPLVFQRVYGQDTKTYKVSIIPFFREQTLSDLRFSMNTDMKMKVEKEVVLISPATTRPIALYYLKPKDKNLKNKYFFTINLLHYAYNKIEDVDTRMIFGDSELRDSLGSKGKEKIKISYKSSQLLVYREIEFSDRRYVFEFQVRCKDSFQTIPREKLINMFLDASIEEYLRYP